MSYPLGTVASVSTEKSSSPAAECQGIPYRKPEFNQPVLTRRYQLSYLEEDGQIETATRLAPAIPDYEEAFSAFARGTVIATSDGPVAVEDLVPGMQALTAEDRCETITWIGSMTLFPPRAMRGMHGGTLTRITADAFGIGRPMPDLVLGPGGRLLLRSRFGDRAGSVYASANNFVDGVSIIEVTPTAAVPVYHVMLERHGSLRAAGLEIESYHPGVTREDRGPRAAQSFLSLFPHLRSFSGFGPLAHPHMTSSEVEAALAG